MRIRPSICLVLTQSLLVHWICYLRCNGKLIYYMNFILLPVVSKNIKRSQLQLEARKDSIKKKKTIVQYIDTFHTKHNIKRHVSFTSSTWTIFFYLVLKRRSKIVNYTKCMNRKQSRAKHLAIDMIPRLHQPELRLLLARYCQ